MIGGPDWMDSDRYDVVAKMADADLDEKGMAPAPELMLRVQSLLEDRFKMVTHWETRELPVYALVVATEGKLGRSSRCMPETAIERAGRPSRAGSPAANCGTRSNMTPAVREGNRQRHLDGDVREHLAGATGRNVIDKTGLAGLVRSRARIHAGSISGQRRDRRSSRRSRNNSG